MKLYNRRAPPQVLAQESFHERPAEPENVQPNLGMQPTTFDNPMGIDGFEFVEFAAPDAGRTLHAYFKPHGLHRGGAPQDARDHAPTARATAPS